MELVKYLEQYFTEAVNRGVFKNNQLKNSIQQKLFNQITLRTRTSAKILSRISQDREQEWQQMMQQNSNNENKLKGILLVGELGMIFDYTKTNIFETIQKLLEVNEDQINQAAAIALGDITTQNQ